MKFLADYTLKGSAQAILVTCVTGMLSLLFLPLSYFSSAALSLVTLRQGVRGGVMVMVGATVAMALLSQLTLGSLTPALLYLLLLWFPVWWLAYRLRLRPGQSPLLLHALGMGGLFLLLLHGAMAGEPSLWWQQTLLPILHELLAQIATAEIDLAQLEQGVALLAPFMNALLVVTLLMHIVGGVMLGRWWQSLLFNPGGFGAEFRAITLGRGVAGMTAGVVLVALVSGSELLQSLLMMAAVVFATQGLAVVHALVRQHGASRWWLVGLYLLLLLAMPQIVLLLALAGLVDNWFDFRKFWQGPNSDSP
ncbi:hypothetical protein D5085_12950 [Ectothiorhodospiraceae bacterium BW-2]|nr:hypothetical protein D5085_12950 [Ectothiorhodospiraceae bacterium BW-2]